MRQPPAGILKCYRSTCFVSRHHLVPARSSVGRPERRGDPHLVCCSGNNQKSKRNHYILFWCAVVHTYLRLRCTMHASGLTRTLSICCGNHLCAGGLTQRHIKLLRGELCVQVVKQGLFLAAAVKRVCM